ncbi:MAG: Ig-like domain-containing protein, partial [Candidatus Thermoplasmatota archaeon]|nr:Ig-like domain-containing protein [Candidatus Thermoplasmatota archaeon]
LMQTGESIEIIYSVKTVNYCQGTNIVVVTSIEDVTDDDIVYVKVQKECTSLPSITLYHPKGGEIINGILTIEWYALDSSYRNQKDLPIYLYYRSTEQIESTYQKIAEELPNTGIFNWSTTEINNGEYQLLIVAQNKQNGIAHETSGPFTIRNTFPMIAEISIEKRTDDGFVASTFIKNGDDVKITATIEDAQFIENSDISANLSVFKKETDALPDSFNKTTAIWMIKNVSCQNSQEANIVIQILNHDEKSTTIQIDTIKPVVHQIAPQNGVYLFDKRILSSEKIIVFGSCTFTYDIHDNEGIEKVDFYVDQSLIKTKTDGPYSFTVHHRLFGKHDITIVVYDTSGNTRTLTRTVQFFKLFGKV